MKNIHYSSWEAGVSFTAYGTNLGVKVNDPVAAARVSDYLPPGWKPSTEPAVGLRYSLLVEDTDARQGVRNYHSVYAGASRLVRTRDLDEALERLGSHLQLMVAANSTENLFVHAGVVAWRRQAIVVPGRSFSGKTELVAALLRAGATYYSDEYAVLDRHGRVRPYPRDLWLREEGERRRRRRRPEELGADVGQIALPVSLVVVTEYHPGAVWQPCSLSPGQALLALLDNTVAARSQPEHALTTLQRVVMHANAIKSARGGADEVTPILLNQLERSVV
jgi:hypothetical protein